MTKQERQVAMERAVIRRKATEHDAHSLGCALLGKEFPRLIAELLLVVGEIEVHGLPFLLLSFRDGPKGQARNDGVNE